MITNLDYYKPMFLFYGQFVFTEDMPDRRLCMSRDEDDCDFYFTYFYDNDQVLAQEKKGTQSSNYLTLSRQVHVHTRTCTHAHTESGR